MASIDIVANGTLNTLVKNGRLNTTDGWTLNSAVNTQIVDNDFLRITANMDAASGTYPNSQMFSSIGGNTAETRQLIYFTAKVRTSTQNSASSWPRVYASHYSNGSATASYSNLSSVDGLKETELNDGKWHTVSASFQTYNATNGSYFEYYRIAFGINQQSIGDIMDVKEIMIFNLTGTFGRGGEPNKAWCDKNLTSFAEIQSVPIALSVEMITDRTHEDVERWNELRNKGFASMSAEERTEWLSPMKGSYNYTDLNRVEIAVEYVTKRLYEYGYSVDPGIRTTWTVQDIPTIADMNRYFDKVKALRSVIQLYSTTPEVPTTERKMDYQMANDLEKILLDVNELLIRSSEAWFYSGNIYLGEV